MSLTNEIKRFVINCEMDVVGICGVERLMNEPQGRRPTDILPGAQSVIVYGKRIADGVMQALQRSHEEGNVPLRHLYGTYGFELAPNFTTMYETFKISQYIERHFGKTAVPLPCGPLQNGMPMNIDHAAIAAGLGELGWSGRVVTPEYGPRIRFGAVITSMKLDEDPLYSGKRLCDPSVCQICVSKCPTNAIHSYHPDVDTEQIIGGKTCTVCPLDKNRCDVARYAMRREFGGFEDFVPSNTPTREQINEGFMKMQPSHATLDHFPSWNCDLCLAYCPIGRAENETDVAGGE